jgi:poly-beta-1,6-N-acetyl-D-glucosamine synthase
LELVITGIFWFIILLLVHAYLFYPLSLRIFNLFKTKSPLTSRDYLPSVSILIAAYNEEKVIAERIENILNLDYDLNKIEVIIGSDCSSDRTNEILLKKSEEWECIIVQIFDERRGKAAVLNDLAQLAKNEIFVFSDANTNFEKNALVKLISEFMDEKVGGVCGRLVLVEPKDDFDKTNRERLYWQYETQLKKLEGNLGTLIAANGGIYAIRKIIFTKFPVEEAITDDLFQTLAVLKQGYDFKYAFDAVAVEEISKEIITEFRRKVRFAATNFQTLKNFKNLLVPKNFLLSYILFSHKVIRWFVPLLLIILFIVNTLLLNYDNYYRIIFYFQIGFYLSALIGYVLNRFKINVSIFSIVYYYVFTNLALLVGLFKFLANKSAYIWDSTPR